MEENRSGFHGKVIEMPSREAIERYFKWIVEKHRYTFRGGFGAPRGESSGRAYDTCNRDRRDGNGSNADWIPVTKVGRLVKQNRIACIEEIRMNSLPLKEHEIIDSLLKNLKKDVIKVAPVQKQTPDGQRIRFKALVAVGDRDGHFGYGVKCAKNVKLAISGAVMAAKLSAIPVRRTFWGGKKIGKPHTLAHEVTGNCDSVGVHLMPAPRGTGIVAMAVPRKMLRLAGVEDCFTSAYGCTATLGDITAATYAAMKLTFSYRSSDLWKCHTMKKTGYRRPLRDITLP